MKSPSEYLSLAKEKVAAKYGYESWSEIDFYFVDSSQNNTVKPYAEERLSTEASLLALELQAEDAEKEKAKAFNEGCDEQDHKKAMSLTF